VYAGGRSVEGPVKERGLWGRQEECARGGWKQVYAGGRRVQGSVLEGRCMREAGVCKGRFEETGVRGRQECARVGFRK
jgi:hypothetical protein